MSNPYPTTASNNATIESDLVGLLTDLTSEWDLDLLEPISANTRLVADLGFDSVDVVQLAIAIEERFQRRKLPFEKLLMVDGRYVDDLTVGQMASFLSAHLTISQR